MTRTVLNIALFLQLAFGAVWAVSIATMEGSGGLEVLGMFVVVFAIQALGFFIGLWAYWWRVEHRRKAIWLLLLPVIFLSLPMVVRKLAGGQLPVSSIVTLLLAATAIALAACIFWPRRVAAKLPSLLFRSRIFNGLILAGPLLGWIVVAGLLIWLFGVDSEATKRAFQRDGTGSGLGAAIAIGAFYLVWLGGVSVLSAAWAWLAMHSGIDGRCRKLNVAQLAVGLPGILAGAIVMVLMRS